MDSSSDSAYPVSSVSPTSASPSPPSSLPSDNQHKLTKVHCLARDDVFTLHEVVAVEHPLSVYQPVGKA